MNYMDEFIEICKNMKRESQFLHKKLSRAPEGGISVIKTEQFINVYQYIYKDGHVTKVGIKRKPELIRALVRKAYYTERVKRLDVNLNILRKAIKKLEPLDDESIIRSMPANITLLDKEYLSGWTPAKMHPVFDSSISPDEYALYIPEEERDRWGEKPYKANSFATNQMQNRTEEGFYVRSKNEMAIFACYKKLGIPIHYDEVMNFKGSLKSPDFISLREDGKIIYHEHCGLVNNTEYMRKHKQKLELYEDCGIVPHSNLIVTYENEYGGINMNLVEAQIKAMHRL